MGSIAEAAKDFVKTSEGGPRTKEEQLKVTSSQPQTDDDRLRRSPDHFFFQVIDLSNPYGFLSEENDIPRGLRRMFTPPYPITKEDRRRLYSAQLAETRSEMDPHAILVLLDVPFFDEFDHGKAVLGLQSRRKKERLPLHFLKSLRPFFPFFVKD
ncbi:hypothetical protein SK128_013215 [Halocaridina rubra]|uniref:Uncharacterized protein n=1 Tax=Halocaridina rubra TaxID=373956 RepID=A0AAN9A306_HALRR